MILRIPVEALRVGMYVHKLDGSWFKHPFLRSSFLLTNPDDLAAIRACGIHEVWIDPARAAAEVADAGAPVAEPQGRAPPAAARPAAVAAAPGPRARADAAPQMHSEIGRARRICLVAKEQVTKIFHEARLGRAIDPATTLPLVDEIAGSIQRHPQAIISVARLKTHDDYTYMHSVAVCALMVSLARQLGFDEEQTRHAGVAGLMHDLGKAAMPLEVLNKPGKLTDAEFAIVREHPRAGAEMLRAAGAEPAVVDVALHHHEKVDGTGYPDRLGGEAISMLARMGAVCDVYDAVTSIRAYKKPWDPSAAMRQMARWEGHFDRPVFNAFVKAVGIYPVGCLVRLSSQRLAVVVEPGVDSLLTPRVRVFFSLRSREPVATQIVDLAAAQCRDSIVAPEDPEKWSFPNLVELSMP